MAGKAIPSYRPTRAGDHLAARLTPHVVGPESDPCTLRQLCAGIVRYANKAWRANMIGVNGAPIRESIVYGMSPVRMRVYDDIAREQEAKAEQDYAAHMARLASLVEYLRPYIGPMAELHTDRDAAFVVGYLRTPDGRDLPLNIDANGK